MIRALSASALVLALVVLAPAQLNVDGVRGSEWTGVAAKHIAYTTSTIPPFTFQAYSDTVAMDVSFRSDSTYLYGLIETKPAGQGNDNYDSAVGLAFANIYFDTNPAANNGSDMGFEVTNNRAFNTGNTGVYFDNSSAYGLVYGQTAGTTYANGGAAAVFEFGVPLSYFQNDPQGVGFPTVPAAGGDVVFRSLQAYGYAFIGDTATYGNDRFGRVTIPSSVPEPASMAALGLGALALIKRRRRNG